MVGSDAPRIRLTGRLARGALAIVLAFLVLVASPVAPVHAESVAVLRARLESIQDRYRESGSDVTRAFDRLDETDVRIAKVRRERTQALKDLRRAQGKLSARATRMYRAGGASPLEVLFGAATFEDFVTRLDFLRRIGAKDAAAVAAVKRERARLAERERRLARERQVRVSDLRELRARREVLEQKLRSTSAEYESTRRALARARAGSAARAASAGSVEVAPGPNGMTFPVAGPCFYADTFGAPRSGGRRHQGCDIMASRGTPIVAPVSGSISASVNGLGGKSLWLHGGGWTFYFAHLDSWAVTSGSVSAGQLIGYVGSTGNASGGAPHLHFEMHPGGGGAVNPYPYLRNMQ